MSERTISQSEGGLPGADEMNSALFAHLVMQQSNMALMLLGKVAHPETGKAVRDVDAAKLFIDMLEMLEAKTKGNLRKEESALLKQTLMTLRLSFVEAVESPAEGAPTEAAKASTESARSEEEAKTAGGSDKAEEEHRPKFSKKY